MSNINIAISLARAGFYVFPMSPSGKFLKGFSWDRDASRSHVQIREWWSRDPHQRIGLSSCALLHTISWHLLLASAPTVACQDRSVYSTKCCVRNTDIS